MVIALATFICMFDLLFRHLVVGSSLPVAFIVVCYMSELGFPICMASKMSWEWPHGMMLGIEA